MNGKSFKKVPPMASLLTWLAFGNSPTAFSRRMCLAWVELVPNDSFPTLSSIFLETLCRSSFENGLFRQSFRQRSDYALLGQALGSTGDPLVPSGDPPDADRCKGSGVDWKGTAFQQPDITAIPPGGWSRLRIGSGSAAPPSLNANGRSPS